MFQQRGLAIWAVHPGRRRWSVAFVKRIWLGHADISTTEIYLHTAKHTGIGVRSPFDTL